MIADGSAIAPTTACVDGSTIRFNMLPAATVDAGVPAGMYWSATNTLIEVGAATTGARR